MRTLLLSFLLLSIGAMSQTQTTHCQGTTIEVPAGQGTYGTGQANCTTTTAQAPAPAMSTQQAYEAGQNLGRGIANMRTRNRVKKFCKKHPGARWYEIGASGVCP
jgi:hypothetical protein